jgi:hypothetical protein
MVRPAKDRDNPRNQRVPVMLSVGELAAVRKLAGERSVSDWIGQIIRQHLKRRANRAEKG